MNIEINGVTLQADFMDADFMEIFEPAVHKMREEINAGKTMQGSVAAKYRVMNRAIETFFDTVLAKELLTVFFRAAKMLWGT